jgi:hypothetical protein
MSQSIQIEISVLQTLLSDYIAKGNLEIIKFLLERLTTTLDYTCLVHKAITANNSDIVKFFIESSSKNGYDMNALLSNTFVLALKSNNLEIIKCYLDNKKNVPVISISISIGLDVITYVSNSDIKMTAIKYLFDNSTAEQRIKMYEHLMRNYYICDERKIGELYNYIAQFKPIIPGIPTTPLDSTTTPNIIEHLEYQLKQLLIENDMLREKFNAISLILADVKKI